MRPQEWLTKGNMSFDDNKGVSQTCLAEGRVFNLNELMRARQAVIINLYGGIDIQFG